MTRLSVNLNKVALLRNSRNIGIPSVIRAAEQSVMAGAQGITVHPRPDQRHIRTSDVYELSEHLKGIPNVEFNIEGNPFPEFLEIVRRVRPAQCTLGHALVADALEMGFSNAVRAYLKVLAASLSRETA